MRMAPDAEERIGQRGVSRAMAIGAAGQGQDLFAAKDEVLIGP